MPHRQSTAPGVLWATGIAPLAHQATQAASREVTRHLNSHLRQMVVAHGWPPELSRHVRMDPTGAIHIHHGSRDTVMDLEYGTQRTAPSPALRRFQARMNTLADEYANNALFATYAEVF